MTTTSDALSSKKARRIYFEQLSHLLRTNGVTSRRIGQLVAELDVHVAMSGSDPVAELGPVGILADELTTSDPDRSPWISLAGDTAWGFMLGTVIALGYALIDGPEPDIGQVSIRTGLIVLMSVLATAVALITRLVGSRYVGSTRFERAALKPLIPFLVVLAAVTAATFNLEWTTSQHTAVVLLLITVPTSALFAIWWFRRIHIAVPGGPDHLRRLENGPLGR